MALSIKYKFGPNDLHAFASGAFGQLLAGLPGGEHGALQHPAFDELPGLQGLIGLLHQIVSNAVLSDLHNRVCLLYTSRDDGQGGGGNTDTMMVGCYDVKNGTVDVLSIYRDTMVDVPGEIPKINSVYNRQGIEGVQKQIKNLIGYTPDYYFVVELDAVAELVRCV